MHPLPGQFALRGERMKVYLNSQNRAARARALVERVLESDARYRVTELTSMEAAGGVTGGEPPAASGVSRNDLVGQGKIT